MKTNKSHAKTPNIVPLSILKKNFFLFFTKNLTLLACVTFWAGHKKDIYQKR